MGGRYICISLLQPHILSHVVSWFSDAGWPVRIIRCREAESGKTPDQTIFPVFAVVCTRFNKMSGMKPVLELALSSDGQLTRLETAADLVASVRGCQQFCALRAGLAGGGDRGQEEASLDLRVAGEDRPRYSLYLTDRGKRPENRIRFAAFITPQGREVEWLFATGEGRRQLADQAACERLVVVHLGRGQQFGSLQVVRFLLDTFPEF